MSNQKTLLVTPSVISSQASVDGALPPVLPDGLTAEASGPGAPLVSPSPSPAKARARKTSATSGRSLQNSSVPDGPLSSWESRLRQRLERIGSTECSLTWKASVTPAARPLSRLVPSMRPIEEIDFGLWPTPQHRDKGGGEYADPKKARARLTSGHQVNLQDHVRALWPTPTANDHARGLTIRPHDTGIPLPQMIAKALWPTPTSLAKAKDGNNEAGNSAGLVAIRSHAMWATAAARDWRSDRGQQTSEELYGAKGRPLPRQVIEALGEPRLGSLEQTEKPGALNPAFVCWLMGFPPAWESCAPTAMLSSRKSQRK